MAWKTYLYLYNSDKNSLAGTGIGVKGFEPMTRVWIIGPLIRVLYSLGARWLVLLPWVLLYKVRSDCLCWALPMEHEIVLWVRSVSVCLESVSSSSVDHVWLSLASARQSHSRAHAIDCHGCDSLSHKEELPSSCNDNYSYEKSYVIGFWNHSSCPVYWWSLVSVGHFSATLKWLKI